MQIPLANMDAAILEEVSIPLWTRLFDAVGWPSSLPAKGAATFSHDDVLNALQSDALSDELLLALETLQIVGTPAGRESVAAVMSDRHIPLNALPYDLGEREFALHVFLKQREDAAFVDVLARVQIQLEEGDHRCFNDFIGKGTNAVTDATSKRQALEETIRDHCEKNDLGNHVQVRVFKEDDGTARFLIMRSDRTRTPLAIIPGSTGRATIKYRPVHADLVRYEAGVGRLRITARSAAIVEFYRRVFGRILFNDDTFFYGDPVCSLRVLQENGRAALERHRVRGVGRIWMTECLWERGDGERVIFRARDCFDTIQELKLNIAEGELLQAKFKMEVTGKSARPVIVSVRAPSRIEVSQGQHESLVNDVLEDIGIRNAKMAPSVDLWSLHPGRHPNATWRALAGSDMDALVNAGALKQIQLDAIEAPGHPGAGRVLQAENVSRGDFIGVSQAPEIPSQSLSATHLDGFAFDPRAFQAHVRGIWELSDTAAVPSDDGLVDLGVLTVGDYSFRLTYALRRPPANAADVINGRAAGSRAIILLPNASNDVPGVPSVLVPRLVPARNALVRTIASRLSLTEHLPAFMTAPDNARLIVDTKRGEVFFDRIHVTGLITGTHPFNFTELVARNAPRPVPSEELVNMLSSGRRDGDQTVRTAKSKAKKAIENALEAAGVSSFEDPFRPENGSYRLTVIPHVV